MNNFLTISAITDKNITSAINFLLPHEKHCVNLVETLLRFSNKSVLSNFFWIIHSLEDNLIYGIFMISPSGLLLHYIQALNTDEKSDFYTQLKDLLSPLFIKTHIECIMGERTGSLFFESISPKSSSQITEYYLYEFKPGRVYAKNSYPEQENLELKHATISDAHALFPLQESYEKEEVLPDGDIFSPSFCMSGLKRSLQNQIVMCYWKNNKPIAKAATNAQGLNWVQLGGVYTEPQWRNKGLARQLVQHIAELAATKRKNSCLFVKIENLAAQTAYKKAGFKHCGDYAIIYIN